MAKFILAREGEPELGGSLNGWPEIILSDRGRAEADWVGLELARFTIDAAFTAQNGTGRSTLDHIVQFQEYSVKRAAVSVLNEFTPADRAQTSIHGAIRRIAPFHQTVVKPRLAHDETVLVVATNNAYRAYIKEVEVLSTEAVTGLSLDRAEVRTYEFDLGKLINRDIQRSGIH